MSSGRWGTGFTNEDMRALFKWAYRSDGCEACYLAAMGFAVDNFHQVQHADSCLVPLAQACTEVSRG